MLSQATLVNIFGSSNLRRDSLFSFCSSPPTLSGASEEENLVGSVQKDKIEIRFRNLSYSVEKEGKFLTFVLKRKEG